MGTIGRVQTVLAGWDGGPGLQTSYYHLDTAWNWAGYHQDLVNGVAAAYASASALFPSVETMTTQAVVDVFDDITGELVNSYTGTDVITAGAGAADLTPTATGICVVWRTQGIRNNKRVRGRSFLVPLCADSMDTDGTPTTVALGRAGTWAAAMETAFGAFGDLVVWSRPKPGSPGLSYFVTSHTIHDQFSVLRSRRD